MRNTSVLLTLALAALLGSGAAATAREEVLSQAWRFANGANDQGASPGLDDSGW